jgi:hypothetical protein
VKFAPRPSPPAARLSLWAALLLLALMFAQLLGAATQLSATIDEGFHITSGYEYLRTGQVRLLDEHTPLVKALFAWPLFFVPDLPPPTCPPAVARQGQGGGPLAPAVTHLPCTHTCRGAVRCQGVPGSAGECQGEEAPGRAEGDLIRVAQATVLAYRPIDRVIVPPRVAVALLTLVLAATVYRWAADWFGPTAGLLALALFAFDPNILAHGSLATTDIGAVAFIFWAAQALARYLGRPTWRRWWTAALLLGLAQGAKLTAALLLPVLGVVMVGRPGARGGWRGFLRRALSYLGMVALAALVVWALYLFEVRTLPEVGGGAWPLPAASHVERWFRLQDNFAYGREAFLLGQNRMHGWWQYFPLTFVLKTPLPTLLLIGLTCVALFFRRGKLTNELALGLFPLIYAAASLTSTLNIGYRHLLPLLPFLFVSAGRVVGSQQLVAGRRPSGVSCQRRFILRLSPFVIVLWLCTETLLIHPHYLAYFNSLAGGPDQGYRFLADSNTDWGQALKALAEYQQRHDLGSVKLSQFTFLDPAAYGVAFEPIAPMPGAPPVLPRRFNPAPGLYAISATTLDGVPLPLPSTYDWFRHREPLARIGHVMFLYDVAAKEKAPEWVAQCILPVAPLTPEAIAEGFGAGVLRRVYFDCEQSWVFPEGGESPGWYALATPGIDGLRWPMGGERLEWWPAWVGQLSLAALRLSYVQPTPGELPSFAIWEWRGGPITPPATLPDKEITFDETLTFLGYQAPSTAHPGTSIDVLTYWRVTNHVSRPLSLMLHLTDGSGISIAAGDGLGVPLDNWQVGDVIVQRHRLDVPPQAPAGDYALYTGVYWLDTLERWPVEVNGRITGDRLLLTEITP